MRSSPLLRPRRAASWSVLAFLAILVAAGLLELARPRFILTRDARWRRDFQRRTAPLRNSDWNVVLVTLDTTRADRLGCYGYAAASTPVIDALARDGILLQDAYCQTPLTLPSHASLFTGLYPGAHGVRDNGGFFLKPGAITLAEVLRNAGWTTSAFISAFVLDSRWGLNQGFDVYYDNFDFSRYKSIGLDTVQRRGGETVAAFLDWIKGRTEGKFFSWIHLYDPHAPYDPPDPFPAKFPETLDGLYDGEIAYVDSLVGTVLSALRDQGLLDKTVIIIAGDHGESLGEHEEDTHGFFIYDATLRVPLLLKLPGPAWRGRRLQGPAELVDVFPTLVQILNLPGPAGIQGKSFLGELMGRPSPAGRSVYAESYYPRYHYGWSELRSLKSSQFKFIDAPSPELYDTTLDPGETRDLSRLRPDVIAHFRRELQSRSDLAPDPEAAEAAPAKLDAETAEKLMALGYIGGPTSAARLSGRSPLGDPKAKIRLYNRIKKAEGEASQGNDAAALRELDAVIGEDVHIMEARQVRAQIYLRQGRPDLAETDCRAALMVDPEYEAALFVLAQAYRRQGKTEEALAGFDRLIALNPRDAKPHLNIAEMALEKKDIERAIERLRRAIELDPPMSAQAHLLLGSAYLERKVLDDAEREIRAALALRPRIPDAHYNLGLLYEERRDIPRALESYAAEIELHPGAYPAHFNLALLLAAAGRHDEEILHLRKAVEANPSFSKGLIFLANALQRAGRDLEEAIGFARQGLKLEPESEFSPLGHYVLADIFSRLGQEAAYRRELEAARDLEARIGRKEPGRG